MSAREDAIATIRSEHNSMQIVLDALRRLAGEIAERRSEPDFALLAAALYYFDDFPERCHHPKEDEFLFKALRARTSRLDDVLDGLQAEHIQSDKMVGYLQRALVHYQGGAPEGLAEFRAAVEAYAAMLEGHMRREERVMAEAGEHLKEEDWVAMAGAFAANVDPLTRPEASADYNRMYSRIVMLLPTKMRAAARERERGRGE